MLDLHTKTVKIMEPKNIYNVTNLFIFVLIFYKPKLPNKYNLNGLAEIESM